MDLDKLVNQTTVVKDSKSDAWKVRKEAFEALSALLEVKSNSRLKPNMGKLSTLCAVMQSKLIRKVTLLEC